MLRSRSFRPVSVAGRPPRAFTLIELLVVVSIIALLISILLPSLKKARDQAKAVQCGTNLRNVGQAVASYLTDSSGVYPPSDVGLYNRYGYSVDGDDVHSGYSRADCSGIPYWQGTTQTPEVAGAITGAFLDVPGAWGTQGPDGDAACFRKPGEAGYGRNPETSDSDYPQLRASLSRNCPISECFAGECETTTAACGCDDECGSLHDCVTHKCGGQRRRFHGHARPGSGCDGQPRLRCGRQRPDPVVRRGAADRSLRDHGERRPAVADQLPDVLLAG